MWIRRSNTFRYTLYGALFGLVFPLLASLGDSYLQQLPLRLESLLQVQKSTPLHWLIDTAPLFLGLFACLAGRRQDQLVRLNKTFEQQARERDQAIHLLQTLQARLEGEVAQRMADLARRSVQLEAAAQVARGAAALRDIEQLLKETVYLISDQFGFYHAGIFLVDQAREYAVLRAASSKGGERMLARSHRLKVGQVGIVGYTAGTGEPRIALDVGEDAVFFDNPDLPYTRSEMALPLKVRDQIIGVLDVQSTEPAAFSEEDVAILQTMADQVALAIDNAYLLEEIQRALRELEALHGQRAREAWRERAAHHAAAYRYTPAGVKPVSPHPTPQIDAQTLPQEEDGRRLVAPIRLRGQSIGSIVLRQDPEAEHWAPEDMALVEEVSAQIGLALENARLLEETQRRVQRERTIRQVAEQMRRAADVETILKTTIASLGQATGAPRVYVRLGTQADSRSDPNNGSAASGSSSSTGDVA